jgi:hypothetical protein
MTNDPLRYMTETERACVQRYIEAVVRRLERNLVEVLLFGSFVRGDIWGRHWPMHSDVDLLILTTQPVQESDREDLINETYPLYLECGRQISPQFRTVAELQQPTTARGTAFKEQIAEEGRVVFSWEPTPPRQEEG